ncbi:hypothetical protein [Streptomyces orinoci]|uniref:Uncharacterized protein n=1 Tax=Streptomyces orinoci TaxID=67339 RepID=A0ABV3K6H0_STRON|nr:hypothetical protein [Streptomyces orinoci]
MPWHERRGRHRPRGPGSGALALLGCGLCCWLLLAATGRAGAAGGLLVAGWGLSLLPVHCVPRPRGRGTHRLTRSD